LGAYQARLGRARTLGLYGHSGKKTPTLNFAALRALGRCGWGRRSASFAIPPSPRGLLTAWPAPPGEPTEPTAGETGRSALRRPAVPRDPALRPVPRPSDDLGTARMRSPQPGSAAEVASGRGHARTRRLVPSPAAHTHRHRNASPRGSALGIPPNRGVDRRPPARARRTTAPRALGGLPVHVSRRQAAPPGYQNQV
jgi:hypothetical protein